MIIFSRKTLSADSSVLKTHIYIIAIIISFWFQLCVYFITIIWFYNFINYDNYH